MSSFSISTGLISGLDFEALANIGVSRRQGEIDRLNARSQIFEAKKTGASIVEANLLSLSSFTTSLSSDTIFNSLSVSNPASDVLNVTASDEAQTGTYKFQAVQRASAHQSVSRGYANSTQKPGAGTLVISQGGQLQQDTLLETLNDGSGIRRGKIRITDRSGNSSVVDLTNALSIEDVLSEINEDVDTQVTASTFNGSIILTDESGSTTSNLSVVDLNGGKAAEDLGINLSVASSELQGNSVFEIEGGFTLDQINDGNGLSRLTGAEDLKITLTDATEIEVNLDDAVTLNDVVQAINNHDDNEGKVTAEVTGGRIVLTDTTAGGGNLTVEDINGSTVTTQLGLDATASGAVLTGNRLGAGLNSVLIRNLNGGEGISERGDITVTDRSGLTATIDLSAAESLDEVLYAINTAIDDGTSDPLNIRATVNPNGSGILIEDTSGATANNLIIADVATGTVAADLGIAIDAAETSIDSGSLNLRYVNRATSLDEYAEEGSSITTGEFQITDSDGNVGVISISSAVKTVGDVIDRINLNDAISVTAQLNETGDGFVLIDEAGGAETLTVEEFSGGTTAADLRILGEGVEGGDGNDRISSRVATVIEIEEDDTIEDIVTKINDSSNITGASIFDDGSQFNSTRLSLNSKATGKASQLFIDDGGLDFNFGTVSQGQDAVLRLGDDPSSSFLLVSENNTFNDVVTGIDVELLDTSDSITEIVLAKDTTTLQANIEALVSTYNQLISTTDDLTKFDSETNQAGILQGDSFVLRILTRLDNALNRRVGPAASDVRSFTDLGIRTGTGGKLTIDSTKLAEVLTESSDDLEQFFTDEDFGIGKVLTDTIESFTDSIDGTLAIENRTLDSSVATLDSRVEQLTILMESQRERILFQFLNMETALSNLQSQQSALEAFTPVSAPS